MEGDLETLNVIVRTMDGSGYAMQVGKTWTVRELKWHLSGKFGIETQYNRLIIGDKIIQNGQLMETWSGAQDSVEIMLYRLPYNVSEWIEKVKKDAMCLKDAGISVQSDPEIVMVAIANNGLALEFASAELRADRDFISRAVSQNAGALAFAMGDMRDDKHFVLSMVKLNGCALAGASERLKADSQVVLAAAKENHYALMHAAKVLKSDHVFVCTLLENRVPRALEWASLRLQKDPRIQALAVRRG